MRLIDADWIFSNLNQTIAVTGKENADAVVKALENYNNLIKDAPTIDAVEVVRCKDCNWHNDVFGGSCHNPIFGDGCGNYAPPCVRDDAFCSYGERKEHETD